MTNKKKIYYSIIIFSFLIILSFIFLEISSRIYSFYVKKNYCAKFLTVKKYNSLPDKILGYKPKEGKKIGCEKENYTINSDGIREYKGYNFEKSNFLIVGDSFGFGDEVSDNETLSYFLFNKYNIRTVNAAVYGYGLDQSLLRAKRIIERKKMNVLLIIAPGGWSRTNLSVRNGIKKPYYKKNKNGQLNLILPNQEEFKKSIATHTLEKSKLIKKLVTVSGIRKYLSQEIYIADMDEIDKSCLILKNFNNEAKLNNYNFDLIFYRDAAEIYAEDRTRFIKSNKLLNCLKKNDINYLDTYKILNKNKNLKLYIKKLYGHPNGKANLLVSKEIYNYINKN